MKSRLTLSIDQDLKLFARQYAKDHNTSISRMVEDLIRSLDYEIHSPQVKALCNTLNIAHSGEDCHPFRTKVATS